MSFEEHFSPRYLPDELQEPLFAHLYAMLLMQHGQSYLDANDLRWEAQAKIVCSFEAWSGISRNSSDYFHTLPNQIDTAPRYPGYKFINAHAEFLGITLDGHFARSSMFVEIRLGTGNRIEIGDIQSADFDLPHALLQRSLSNATEPRILTMVGQGRRCLLCAVRRGIGQTVVPIPEISRKFPADINAEEWIGNSGREISLEEFLRIGESPASDPNYPD